MFVHFTGIALPPGGGRRNLAEGERVEFEIIEGAKGEQAANATVIGGDDASL